MPRSEAEKTRLSELIFAMEVSSTYVSIPKATDADLRELAKAAIRAAAIFTEVENQS
jgi:hypothetical protein